MLGWEVNELLMEVIKLIVSKKKNAEKLKKITDDPAFIVSLLKYKGIKECPDGVEIKIGHLDNKNDEEKQKY